MYLNYYMIANYSVCMYVQYNIIFYINPKKFLNPSEIVINLQKFNPNYLIHHQFFSKQRKGERGVGERRRDCDFSFFLINLFNIHIFSITAIFSFLHS